YRVEVPTAAGRIATLGSRKALVGPGRIDDILRGVELEREVGDDPAVGEGVVHDNRVAEVVRVTEIAEVALAHERVEGERRDADAVGLAVDPDRSVDRLDVVLRAHVAVRVRRVAGGAVGEVEAVKVR